MTGARPEGIATRGDTVVTGRIIFCARAWTQKVVRPLLHAIGSLLPAWKTQNAKTTIKNNHGSVGNRCYKANDP